jgi:hypothetical protein
MSDQKSEQQLFRERPLPEVITAVLEALGFSGLEDSREFQKEDLALPASMAEDWLPFLGPYYYPCKATLYIKKAQTPESILVILRQLLRLEGYKLCGTEKQRQTIYSIQKDIYHTRWKNLDYAVSFD